LEKQDSALGGIFIFYSNSEGEPVRCIQTDIRTVSVAKYRKSIDIKGKIAVATGAASGIGRAIAVALARQKAERETFFNSLLTQPNK